MIMMQILNRIDAMESKLARLTLAVERLASLPQISIVNTGRDTANSDSSVNINDSDVTTRDVVGGDLRKRDEMGQK